MRAAILFLLFSVLLVLSLGKPAEKQKEIKGRWYKPGTPLPVNGTLGKRWGGGYFYAQPHPQGGWWVTPAGRPRPAAG